MKVLVIGGGAAGMMAALTASQKHEVTLIERQNRVGRKLLATGNGRCNLTNRKMGPEHYHGEEPEFCRYALETYGPEKMLEIFRGLGLVTVTEDSGRVYPYSDSANSVADVLRLPLEQSDHVSLVTGCEVTSLRRKKGRFYAEAGDQTFEGDCAIVCAGGLAGGRLGGTDGGYRLLSSFGHSRTVLSPSLVQLRTDTSLIRSLKGVRCEAEVRSNGERYRGEVQFTEYGVSGPVIFELSRNPGEVLTFNFLPDLPAEDLKKLLLQRMEQLPRLPAEDLLTGILHNRLGRTLLRGCGCSLEIPCGELRNQIEKIMEMIRHFSLRVTGNMGMDHAQVTAGGMKTSEFRPDTLESRRCKGLYAAGEVLDIDGDCGGYNLQWAWASGRLAGELRGSCD